MANVTDPGLYPLGVIAKAQGTRGGFLMEIDDPAAANDLPDLLYLRYPETQWVPYRIEEIRPHQTRRGNVFFVRLEGITTRTEAEQLRNHDVMTDKTQTGPPSAPDDVIGCRVIRKDGSLMGKVADLMETPAYSILVVQAEKNIVLIPRIDQFVSGINLEEGEVRTRNTEDLESLD